MQPLDPQIDPDFQADTVELLRSIQCRPHTNKQSILIKLITLGDLIRKGSTSNHHIIASKHGRHSHLVDYQVKFFGVVLVMEHNITNDEILYRYKP